MPATPRQVSHAPPHPPRPAFVHSRIGRHCGRWSETSPAARSRAGCLRVAALGSPFRPLSLPLPICLVSRLDALPLVPDGLFGWSGAVASALSLAPPPRPARSFLSRRPLGQSSRARRAPFLYPSLPRPLSALWERGRVLHFPQAVAPPLSLVPSPLGSLPRLPNSTILSFQSWFQASYIHSCTRSPPSRSSPLSACKPGTVHEKTFG